MNLYESIKNNLKESDKINYKELPDKIKEDLNVDGKVDIYYCDNCDYYFKNPTTKNVDMENFYGVGSDFPDHHHQRMDFCPNCGSQDIHELHLSLEDIIDDYIDDYDNYEIIYNEFAKKYPELINSDTIPTEEYYDMVYDLVKDLGLYEK